MPALIWREDKCVGGIKCSSMKIRKMVDSFNFAIDGLLYSVSTQRNMKIHFIIALLTLILAAVINVTRMQAIILLIVITMVIVAEMINTAIEAVVDRIGSDYHPLAAIAKNVAAGAVLITAVNAIAVGYLIFYDRLNSVSLKIVGDVSNLPIHVTVISLTIVFMVVIVIKAVGEKGTFLRGGMPSGHSALAMSLVTSIALLSLNVLITGLAAILALIVFHSRMEAKVHTFWEVVIGGVIGFLVTLIAFQISAL